MIENIFYVILALLGLVALLINVRSSIVLNVRINWWNDSRMLFREDLPTFYKMTLMDLGC
jgi:hypothetical protein